MAKDQGQAPALSRGGRPVAAAAIEPPKKRVSIVEFFREVRAEARKVTWTSWKETWITSTMVFIMVIMASLFFFAVDAAFSFTMQQVLKIGTVGQ